VCWRSVLPCDGGKFSGGGAIRLHDDGDRQHLHQFRKRWRFFPNITPQAGQNANANATTTNSGTAIGFTSVTNGGGNATATNSGSNTGGFFAQTMNGGNATVANSGSNTGGGFIARTNAGGNATATNSGTANFFESATIGGGNATATNSGSNTGAGGGNAVATNSGSNVGGFVAQTAFGNATATNTGNDTGVGHTFGDVVAVTLVSGNAAASNSGTIGDANAGNFSFLMARTQIAGNATAIKSGSSAGGVVAETLGTGNASATNSGTTAGNVAAETMGGGDATATNSGSAAGVAAATFGGGNATATNSGSAGGVAAVAFGRGNATVINSGTANGSITVVAFGGGSATLTNIVGGRVIGPITMFGANNTVNFRGGNCLFTVVTNGSPTSINTGGAPFVVSGSFSSMSGAQVAVLDPTTFALADRSLTNFTGEISEMLQGRFGGMSAGAGGPGALGFAGAPSSPVASEAQAAFSGIPSVANSSFAMSYTSGGSRPVFGKAPEAAPYYDTTIWASGFGGERKQRADGVPFCPRPIPPSAAPWASIASSAAISASALSLAPAQAANKSNSTCRRSTRLTYSAAPMAASTGSRNIWIFRCMAAALTTRARARSPTIPWRTESKPRPRAMAAGSSVRK